MCQNCTFNVLKYLIENLNFLDFSNEKNVLRTSRFVLQIYHTANSNDNKNMITQNVSASVCFFWFYCKKIDFMIELQEI